MAMTSDKLPIKRPPADQVGQVRRGYRYPGRPAHYTEPEAFAGRCEEYFNECQADDRKPTKAGLIRHLGFVSYTAWYQYREKEQFKDICTWCELVLDEILSEMLLDADNSRILVGIIFYLKCTQGWRETDQEEGKLPISISFGDFEEENPNTIEGEVIDEE